MKRIVKKNIPFLFLFFTAVNVFSQVPSFTEKIRIPLWAEIDVYPGLEGSADYEGYEYPVKEIKKTAQFLLNGMVYGWDFVYVPSDKARGVEEYFEITEIHSVGDSFNKISYSSPWIDDTLLKCWCEYNRTKVEIDNYKSWSSIIHPLIRGKGYGSIELGFDGIREAAKDSLKNAVREYFRGKVKNKPKEISGSVLIKNEPLLGIDSGRYTINLDFFLEYDKIIEYTVY